MFPVYYRGSNTILLPVCIQGAKSVTTLTTVCIIQGTNSVGHTVFSPVYIQEMKVLPTCTLFTSLYNTGNK